MKRVTGVRNLGRAWQETYDVDVAPEPADLIMQLKLDDKDDRIWLHLPDFVRIFGTDGVDTAVKAMEHIKEELLNEPGIDVDLRESVEWATSKEDAHARCDLVEEWPYLSNARETREYLGPASIEHEVDFKWTKVSHHLFWKGMS